ncbi:hypothetical protein FC789_02680 [Clostridium botulinum]|uniref:hypothetical protein n=1 Tax=Clostridium cagae TaxID=2080751 RepID=UPI0013C7E860|nr:hypothetical protein [Clostridium botulinum]NFI58280.1 hypothetical protein [Clostridium botulinum]NFI95308.1 hypothetical protein [Clostridium botulinum]NFO92944.1 hypothetical protein [Clostridium botulinum]
MRVKYKKNFRLSENIKVKISTNGNITIITKYKDNNISLNKNRLIVYGQNGDIKRQKQLWIFKKKKLNLKFFIKGVQKRKNKLKNKRIIVNEIISRDENLNKGISKYKTSRVFFWWFLILAFILRKNSTVLISSIIISIYCSIQAFNNIKYKKAYLIANNISKDISFMNLYNEEKVNELLGEFSKRYGSDVKEFIQLKNAVNCFKECGISLANDLSNLEIEDVSYYLKNINLRKEELKNNKYNRSNNDNLKNKLSRNISNNRTINYISSFDNSFNNKLAVLYRKEVENSLDVKSINRAIEFFEDDENTNEKGKERAVVSKDDNKLTVYFYKKSSVF